MLARLAVTNDMVVATDTLTIAPSVTGAEILAKDWSATALDAIDTWPTSLRFTLATMLACPTPMFLAWGPALLCLYNDAYRPTLGYRLATALGEPFKVVWASIWDEIEPLVTATLAGESGKLVDMPLDLQREGPRRQAVGRGGQAQGPS